MNWLRRLFCMHLELVWLTQLEPIRPRAHFPLAVCQRCKACMWGTQVSNQYTWDHPKRDLKLPGEFSGRLKVTAAGYRDTRKRG